MARKERRSVKTEKKDNFSGVNVVKAGKVVKGQSKNVQNKKAFSAKPKCPKCSKVVLNFHRNKLNLCGSCLKNEASSSQKANKIVNKVKVFTPSSIQVYAKAGETSRKSNRINDKNNSPKLTISKRNNPVKPVTPKPVKVKKLDNKSQQLKKNERTNTLKANEANSSKSSNKRKLESGQTENKMSLRGKKRSYAQLVSGISPKEENKVKKIKNPRTSKDKRESRSKKPTVKGSEWLNTLQSKKVISPKQVSSRKVSVQTQPKIKSPRLKTELTNKGKRNVKVPSANIAGNKLTPQSNVKRKSVGNENQNSKKRNFRVNKQTEVSKPTVSRAKPQRKNTKVVATPTKVLQPSKNKVTTKRNVKSQEENKLKESIIKTEQASKKDNLRNSIKKKFDSFANKSRDSEPELKENVLIAREILQDILNSVVSSSKTSVKCDDIKEEDKDVTLAGTNEVMEVDQVEEPQSVCKVGSTNLVLEPEESHQLNKDQKEVVINKNKSMDASEFDSTGLKSKIEVDKSKSAISTVPGINKLGTTSVSKEESQFSTIEDPEITVTDDKLDPSPKNIKQNENVDESECNKSVKAENDSSKNIVQISEEISAAPQISSQNSSEKIVLIQNSETEILEELTNAEKQDISDKNRDHMLSSIKDDAVSVQVNTDFNQEFTGIAGKTKTSEDDGINKLHTEEDSLNRISKIENGICITYEKEKTEGEVTQVDKNDDYLVYEEKRNGTILDETETGKNNTVGLSPNEDVNVSKDFCGASKCIVNNLQEENEVTSVQQEENEVISVQDISIKTNEKNQEEEGQAITDTIHTSTNPENTNHLNTNVSANPTDSTHSQSTTSSVGDDSNSKHKIKCHGTSEKKEISVHDDTSEANKKEKENHFPKKDNLQNIASSENTGKNENNVCMRVMENSSKSTVFLTKSSEEDMEFEDEIVPSTANCKQDNNKLGTELAEEIIVCKNSEELNDSDIKSNIRPIAFEGNKLDETFNDELGIEKQLSKTIHSKIKQEKKESNENSTFIKDEDLQQNSNKIIQHQQTVVINEDNSEEADNSLQSKEESSVLNKSDIVLSNAVPVLMDVNKSLIETNNKSEHEVSLKRTSFNGNSECKSSYDIASKVVLADMSKVCASSKAVQNVQIEEDLSKDNSFENENSPNNCSMVKDKENILNHVQGPKNYDLFSEKCEDLSKEDETVRGLKQADGNVISSKLISHLNDPMEKHEVQESAAQSVSQPDLCSSLRENSVLNVALDESPLVCENEDSSQNDESCTKPQSSLELNLQSNLNDTSVSENLVQSQTIISGKKQDPSIEQSISNSPNKNEVNIEKVTSQAVLDPENLGVKIIQNESCEKQIFNLPTGLECSKDRNNEDVCSNVKLMDVSVIATPINLPDSALFVNQKEDEGANDQASATCSDTSKIETHVEPSSANKICSPVEKLNACEVEKDYHSDQIQDSTAERMQSSSKGEEVDVMDNQQFQTHHCENISFTSKAAVETSQIMDQETPPATDPDLENHIDTNFSSCETSAQFSSKMDDVTEDCISVDDADGESMVCNSETHSSSNRMSIDEENAAMELDLEDTAVDNNRCPTLDTKVSDEMTMEVS